MGVRRFIGRCNLCGGIYHKAGMSRHLESCLKTKRPLSPDCIPAFHIVVEGYYHPEYWMHLEAKVDATLRDLDLLLRRVWLECCGHMSGFTIWQSRYVAGPDEDMEMNVALNKVLAPRLRFYYTYDFGSSTNLVLRVVSKWEGSPRKVPIRILARNELPQIRCEVCGKIATRVCPNCIHSEDEAWFCDNCARKHECGEDILLPVVNSPRVGVCGYTGQRPRSIKTTILRQKFALDRIPRSG